MSAQASLFPARVVVVPSRDELPYPWRLWPEPIAVCCGCGVIHPEWSVRPEAEEHPNHHGEGCTGQDYRIWGGE